MMVPGQSWQCSVSEEAQPPPPAFSHLRSDWGSNGIYFWSAKSGFLRIWFMRTMILLRTAVSATFAGLPAGSRRRSP